MRQVWQLQEAKNKLSEVVNRAHLDGSQIITRRGRKEAVVLSFAEYQRFTGQQESLTSFFRNSPLVRVDLDLERDKSPVLDRVSL